MTIPDNSNRVGRVQRQHREVGHGFSSTRSWTSYQSSDVEKLTTIQPLSVYSQLVHGSVLRHVWPSGIK